MNDLKMLFYGSIKCYILVIL